MLMTNSPDTRASLILRLRDPADEQAWHDFCRIYEPVIAAVARRHGLQDADVHDLTQQVLIRVANAAEGYDPNPELGKFRAWLHWIARNTLLSQLKKRYRMPQSASESWIQQLLDGRGGRTGEIDERLEFEYRRAVFRIAATQVKREVKSLTWRAFWLTTVEDRTVEQSRPLWSWTSVPASFTFPAAEFWRG
jgi:RNA polymerase sigma factor (sigma-70 family)